MSRFIAWLSGPLRWIWLIYENRGLLYTMVKNDLRTKYLNNYLGIVWAFVQPVATIAVLWFVFEMGFRVGAVGEVPFILWLSAGLVPWFYIAECLTSASTAVRDNAFLVKKIVFETTLLPVVKLASAFFVHLIFVVFLAFIVVVYQKTPSWYWLQIPYYSLSATILLLGIGWLTSSVVVFFNDLTQIILIATQFGFWLTPIFWQLSMVPVQLHWIFMLNPVFYIVEGFRDSFINHIWFWEKPAQAAVYWFITFVLLWLGSNVFNRLRPHFADIV